MNIRLRKKLKFDAAHLLTGYKGNCKNVHGHTWRVLVDVQGDRRLRNSLGMLVDFGEIKQLIMDKYDHSIIIRDCKQNKDLIRILLKMKMKVLLMDYNPTCENIVMNMWKSFKAVFPELCFQVRLYETESSSAQTGDVR